MLNPEKQESQIVEPDFEPPPSHQPQYDSDPAEEEPFSHVGETQFTGLEQDICKSLVEDTQFDDLELDTQAQGDLQLSPNTERIIQPVQPVTKPVESSFFSGISRPSIAEDLNGGFAFGKAVKPPLFGRTLGKRMIDDRDTLPQKSPPPAAQPKVQNAPRVIQNVQPKVQIKPVPVQQPNPPKPQSKKLSG